MPSAYGSHLEPGKSVSHDGAKRSPFPRGVLSIAALLLGVWLTPAPAAAQISPGPLAHPHQSLNGTANCTTCHRLSAGEPTFKCLDCHTEIASRINAHRGLHSTYNIKPGSSQECARCHSDHNGESFPLIKWDTKTFDHKLTGYVLEGKHAGLTCNRCHSADHLVQADHAAIKIKDLNRTFLGLSQTCTTCHQDHHEGRLGQNCLQCHTYNDWKTINVGKFDHSKTRFPLTGMHAPVACAKCHTPGPDNKPRYTGLAFGKCSDCHADPHKGAFPQGCASCHSTSGWKKISTSVLSQNFDHSKTKFPLLGKHATVNCALCHVGGDFKKPLAFAKCMDCHKDEHGGQFVQRPGGAECASCHTVNGFKPSTFTVADHAQTQYPLKGGHAKLECEQCHVPKGKDTVFKLKFAHCTDCHKDEHGGQFAGAPYANDCERCHTVEGYHPSTFTLARHKDTRFVLTGGHVAIPCADCHKESVAFKPKPLAQYHWQNLACTSCHADPHKGQFEERMRAPGSNGVPGGCQACHSTKTWNDLTHFDHATTSFPLAGAHRATACIDCHKPPNLETKLINVDFKAAPGKCEECHEEIHGKQFAKNGVTACAECHNSSKWKPSTFDHETRTAFSLQGAHRNVRCVECHKLTRAVEGKQVLFYKPTPRDCAACHGAT